MGTNRWIARSRLLNDYLRGRDRLSTPPINLIIETLNVCNLRCTMCSTPALTRDRGLMSFDRFKRVIDQVADYCECVDLSFSGEPLLHPDVVEQVSYVKRTTGIKVFMQTNGTRLDEATAHALLEAELDWLAVDIDGATADTYEAIRVGGDYETVRRNTERLLELRRELGAKTHIELAIIDMPATRGELDRFDAHWRAAGADSVRLKPYLSRLAPGRDESPASSGHGRGDGACYLPWRELVVLHDGTVASCCLDQQSVGESVLGHMDEASIVEIWNGDQARRNRRLHASGRWREVEPCRGCSPVQPPLPLLAGTPLFDALGVKRMTARLERLTRRIPIRLY